jgi:hypothetical protein
MLYAITLHFLAGTVAGAAFRVNTLLILLGCVAVEHAILAYVHNNVAVPLVFASLVVVQVGYLAGIYGRGIIEHVMHSSTSVRTRRMP